MNKRDFKKMVTLHDTLTFEILGFIKSIFAMNTVSKGYLTYTISFYLTESEYTKFVQTYLFKTESLLIEAVHEQLNFTISISEQ